MATIANTENFIELHEQLNEFAKFHQKKATQEAIAAIKFTWEKYNNQANPNTSEGKAFSLGVDEAFKAVIDTLQNIL